MPLEQVHDHRAIDHQDHGGHQEPDQVPAPENRPDRRRLKITHTGGASIATRANGWVYVMPTSHDGGKTSEETADFVSGSARGVSGVPPRST